jgi:micrococcal nuclease
VIRVIDGDTLILDIDLGMRIHTQQVVRLLGVNTPEIVGESRAAGLAAKEWVELELARHDKLLIETHLDKNDKYGRLLATVWLSDNETLNEAIIADGHGVKM